MRIFIAGGSGAIGRFVVPMFIAEGHRVTALTRSAKGAAALGAMGAESVIGDVYDHTKLVELVCAARPDVVIHQLTAFGATTGDPLAETIRIRIEGTANLVTAAKAAGARRFIAQSISFICAPVAAGYTTEESALYLEAPPTIRALAESVATLERQTLSSPDIEGIVLRYGWFYGPGTNYDPNDTIPRAIQHGRMAIVGSGAGTYSFIHVRDAASATVRALTHAKPGIYNIVDDEPSMLRDWLPYAAKLLAAPVPKTMPEELARQKLGDMLVYVFNEQSGASNAKARRELGWEPSIRSWRDGFAKLYAG